MLTKTEGSLIQDIHAGGVTYGYGYNAAARMVSVTQGGSYAGAYAYDFLGRRVWRQTFGTGAIQTAYVYDTHGHLLAEHNAVTGAMTREYIWIDDKPVALIDNSTGTPAIDYIHTGQIDEPLMVTSASQTILWNAYIDPFGTAMNIGTPTTSLDMRLPGQSFQLEANSLHQNGWRDYDPSLGRYIEADPLGILAGQNVYAYVGGDALNATDRSGKFGVWGAVIGAAFGGGIDLATQLSNNGGQVGCVDFREVGASALGGAVLGFGAELIAPIFEAFGEVSLAENSVGDYLAGSGGRLGSAATRSLNNDIATNLEDLGYDVTNGAGRGPEEFIPGPGGGVSGSTYVDITATDGTSTIRVQTIDTLANGITPTSREAAAAARIQLNFPNDRLILVPK